MTDIDTEEKAPAKDDPVAVAILAALTGASSLSFKDIAMKMADARRRPKDGPDLWKRYLTAVKQQAVFLARQGRIEIVRKGEVADPNDFKGIVRLRLPQDPNKATAKPKPGSQ
ncbi:DUF3253 domain-containing protein [Magnetovibrio sp.]|uniref:DUF3253 domain-containing protein n=1 Tax=Magnetovibrio sp. TaxID=2024836 RepID=UPI002F91F4FD